MEQVKMYPREREFARSLDKQGIKWEYPCQAFKLGDTSYQPDFYLPTSDEYIEIVGTRPSYNANYAKYAKFRKLYPKIKFKILDYKGMVYPEIPPERKKSNRLENRINMCFSYEDWRKIELLAQRELQTSFTWLRDQITKILKTVE